jgi:hypothetical protein
MRVIEQKLSKQLCNKDQTNILYLVDKYKVNAHLNDEISYLILQYKQQEKQLEENNYFKEQFII